MKQSNCSSIFICLFYARLLIIIMLIIMPYNQGDDNDTDDMTHFIFHLKPF